MELKKAMEQRRAVNYFDPHKDVGDEELRAVIRTASLAPSGFNLQPWELIVVRSLKDRERLKEAAWNQQKIVEAPVVLIVLADMQGWQPESHTFGKVWQNMVDLGYIKPEQREWLENGTKKLYGGGEKSVAFAVKNAAFFAMSLMLAAKDAGLDTHPMDGFDPDAVRHAFSIPENYFIPLLIAVGHMNAAMKLMPPKWRKSYEDIVLRQY